MAGTAGAPGSVPTWSLQHAARGTQTSYTMAHEIEEASQRHQRCYRRGQERLASFSKPLSKKREFWRELVLYVGKNVS